MSATTRDFITAEHFGPVPVYHMIPRFDVIGLPENSGIVQFKAGDSTENPPPPMLAGRLPPRIPYGVPGH